MKTSTIFSRLFVLFLGLFLALTAQVSAQVSGYTRAITAGTYTPIVGGTSMSVTGSWWVASNAATGGAGDAVNFAAWNGDVNENVTSTLANGFPIGFTFNYGGFQYDRFAIASSGHITLGKTGVPFATGQYSYNDVNPGASSGAFGVYGNSPLTRINLNMDNSLRALNHSLIDNIGATVKYQLTGISPNRVLTVEWANFSRSFANTVDNINFQIKLNENGNTADFVYGPMTLSTSAIAYYQLAQVGLRGVTTEYLSTTAPTYATERLMVNGGGGILWASAVANLTTPSSTSIDFKSTNFPASGLTYTYTPPAFAGCGPKGLVTVNVVGTTANLSWPAAYFGAPVNYQIERRLNDGLGSAFVAIATSPVAGLSTANTGLVAGSSYEYRMRTDCGGTFSKWETFIANVPGPGENCGTAIGPLSIAANIGALTYTVITDGNTQDGPASCAGGGPSDDIWYTFVAPSDGSSLVITTAAQGAFDDDWVMEVYDGCPSGVPGSLIACNDDQVAGVVFTPEAKICQFEYTNGQTYYIRMYTWGSSTAQQIQLGIYKDVACPIVPANNECINATLVTLEDYGNCPANQVTFTTENATPSVGQPGASCDATTKNDVFIYFNSGINTSALVNISLITATQLGMQVMTACGGTQVMCANPAAGFWTINGLTPGQDYYIRLWSNNSSVWGSFQICVQKPGVCPTDLGAIGAFNAGTISAGTPYNATGHTTCGSGNDFTSTLISSNCGSGTYLSGEDNVYYFDVATNGLYEILVSGSSNNLGIKLYNGCPLAGGTGICVSNAGSSSSNQKLLGLNLTTGNTYYLIVDKASGGCNLSFSVDIQVAAPAPLNDNCAGATTITQGAVCSYVTDYYNAAGTNSGAAVCPGSSADADDDVWFKFIAGGTGDVVITVNPSTGYAPVIQLYGPAACGGPSLCCVTAGGVGAATSLRSNSPLTPGQMYFVRVYDFFTGPPSTQDFDICVTDATVPAGNCVSCPGGATLELEACGTSSNGTFATAETIAIGANLCGKGFAGCNTRDIDYYKFTTPGAGYFTATVNAEFQMVMQIFNSDGVTVLASANLPSECSGNVSLTNPTSLPAGTYYLLVAPNVFTGYPCGSLRNDYSGNVLYSPTPPPPPANDNCSGAITLVPCSAASAASTLNATQSLPSILCTGFQGQFALDVWYKFVANSNLHQISTNGTFNGVMEVFGDYCGGPSITCMDDDIPSVGFETLLLSTTIGRTYYIRYYALATVGVALPGTFSIAVSTPNGWSGATNTNWNLASNWCSGAVPGSGTNIVVPDVSNDPVMLTAGSCNNLLLAPGGNITVTPANLTVNGNITASGNNSVSGTGAIVFGGAALATLTGNLAVQNANVTNTSVAGFTVGAGSNLNVSGVLTPAAGSRTTATGNVVIVSNSTTDGSIGAMGAGAQLNGTNYVLQRYIGNNGWHFLGTASAGNNIGQWTDDFDIKANAPLGGANGVGLVSTDHASIYELIEAVHNFKLDTNQKDGWRIPVSNSLTPGKGFRVWTSPGYFANNPSRIVENIGGVTNGLGAGFNFPSLTRNDYAPCYPTTPTFDPTQCNESNRGWNLLANPLPSNINWDAAGWTKPGIMNNAFFTWNGPAGGYTVYVGAGGSALGQNASVVTNPNMIAKGQGFMVRLNSASPGGVTLSATEAVKSATSATFVRSAVAYNDLKVRISKNDLANVSFDAMIRFMDGATDAYDQHIDANLLTGINASVGFVAGNENLVMSSYAPLTGTKTVVLKTFYGGQVGAHKLEFLDQSTFPASQHIYLKDKFLNALVDIKANPVYNFTVAYANNSNTNDRFEIIFSPSAITEVKPALLDGTSFSIYPNPTSGKNAMAYVTGSVDEKVTITVTDMVGRIVYKSNMTILADGDGQHEISAKLSAGVYNVSCVGKSKVLTTKMVVN